jgi:hypothetical protein
LQLNPFALAQLSNPMFVQQRIFDLLNLPLLLYHRSRQGEAPDAPVLVVASEVILPFTVAFGQCQTGEWSIYLVPISGNGPKGPFWSVLDR